MSQIFETNCRPFTAGAARGKYLRVYMNGSTLTTAGTTQLSIGVQEQESFAAADIVPVRLPTASGSRKMVAAGAITAGDTVYAASTGTIASSGTVVEGVALEAATAANDVIEVAPAINTALSSTFTGAAGNAGGVGITGTAAVWETSVRNVGGLIKTEILIDLTGLNCGGTAGDIIGADGAGVAHLGQVTAALNGTIVAAQVRTFETPAGGDTDIDLYSATEATGVEDTAIGDLTETQLLNSGGIAAGDVDVITPPAADQYLYLVGQTGGDAAYSAGILLIELWGV